MLSWLWRYLWCLARWSRATHPPDAGAPADGLHTWCPAMPIPSVEYGPSEAGGAHSSRSRNCCPSRGGREMEGTVAPGSPHRKRNRCQFIFPLLLWAPRLQKNKVTPIYSSVTIPPATCRRVETSRFQGNGSTPPGSSGPAWPRRPDAEEAREARGTVHGSQCGDSAYEINSHQGTCGPCS
jgi:hypothetical protein